MLKDRLLKVLWGLEWDKLQLPWGIWLIRREVKKISRLLMFLRQSSKILKKRKVVA